MKRFSVGSCMRGYHVYNGTQLAKKSHNKTLLVQILTCGDSAAMWVENFGVENFVTLELTTHKKKQRELAPHGNMVLSLMSTSISWYHRLVSTGVIY